MSDFDVFSNLKKNKQEEIKKEDDKLIKELIKEDKIEKKVDDPKEKIKLIYQIQHFGNNKRFGEYLKNECHHNFDEAYLRKLTIEELKLELDKQSIALSNKNNNSLIDNSLEKFIEFVENIVHNKTRYKIKGTTEKLFADDHFLDLLEILKLKYNIPFLKMDPMLEISLIILQAAFIQHQANSFMTGFKPSVDLDEEI